MHSFKKIIKLISFNILALSFILLIIEFTLRRINYFPLEEEKMSYSIYPKSFYIQDSLLGYSICEGDFTVEKNKQIHYQVKIDSLHNRITSVGGNKKIKKIFIEGCSFSFGECLNDSDTYAFLLQKKLNAEYKVYNFSVNGYGLTNMYLHFNQILQNKLMKPNIVIFAYASFLDQRTVGSREYIKTLNTYQRGNNIFSNNYIPYFRLKNDSIQLEYTSLNYLQFPFQKYSSIINLIEDEYTNYDYNKRNAKVVTQKIFKNIKQLSEKYNIKIIIAALSNDDDTKEMLLYCKDIGLYTTDISINYADSSMNLLPFDPHPSPKANKIYAERLFNAINLLR